MTIATDDKIIFIFRPYFYLCQLSLFFPLYIYLKLYFSRIIFIFILFLACQKIPLLSSQQVAHFLFKLKKKFITILYLIHSSFSFSFEKITESFCFPLVWPYDCTSLCILFFLFYAIPSALLINSSKFSIWSFIKYKYFFQHSHNNTEKCNWILKKLIKYTQVVCTSYLPVYKKCDLNLNNFKLKVPFFHLRK